MPSIYANINSEWVDLKTVMGVTDTVSFPTGFLTLMPLGESPAAEFGGTWTSWPTNPDLYLKYYTGLMRSATSYITRLDTSTSTSQYTPVATAEAIMHWGVTGSLSSRFYYFTGSDFQSLSTSLKCYYISSCSFSFTQLTSLNFYYSGTLNVNGSITYSTIYMTYNSSTISFYCSLSNVMVSNTSYGLNGKTTATATAYWFIDLYSDVSGTGKVLMIPWKKS